MSTARSLLERPEEPVESGAANSGTIAEDEAMEVDGINTMMAGVKSRGGKELLKYVKGLLG
jgi:hypothetical protein